MTRLATLGLLLCSLLAAPARCDKSDAVATATEKLRRVAEAAANGKKVRAQAAPGSLGTTVVRASIEGAYPGTGVYAVVVDGGASYGAHGDQPIGALLQKRGFYGDGQLPDVTALLGLVNDAQFEGLLMIDSGARAPSAKLVAGAIELRLVRRSFPSNYADDSLVRIPPGGAATLQDLPSETAKAPPPEPADPVVALEAALTEKRFGDAVKQVDKLRGHKEPRAVSALARAVALGNTLVAGTALDLLGATPESAAALKAAFVKLDGETRAQKVKLVTEFFGASFAAPLAGR